MFRRRDVGGGGIVTYFSTTSGSCFLSKSSKSADGFQTGSLVPWRLDK